jgi:hypothetical protein
MPYENIRRTAGAGATQWYKEGGRRAKHSFTAVESRDCEDQHQTNNDDAEADVSTAKNEYR